MILAHHLRDERSDRPPGEPRDFLGVSRVVSSCGMIRIAARVSHAVRRWADVAALCLIGTCCIGAAGNPDHAPPPSRSADGFSIGPGWTVTLGSAYFDTLPFPRDRVLPVAVQAIAADEWRVGSADEVTGRIVTHWKPVRHLFVRLVMGEIRERCVIDVTPLGAQRCVVKFRAALATRKSIARSSLMPRVEKEYKESVIRWQRRVRRALARSDSLGVETGGRSTE